MQTAPKGTYSGMLHCATGILKNEGPLAFYKVLSSVLYPLALGSESVPDPYSYPARTHALHFIAIPDVTRYSASLHRTDITVYIVIHMGSLT